MGKPIGEITHQRYRNVEDLPRQPKYTNTCPWGNPYKGGGLRPPPFVISFTWVSPWAQVHVFGLRGQVIHIFIAPMCDFSYGCPPWHRQFLLNSRFILYVYALADPRRSAGSDWIWSRTPRCSRGSGSKFCVDDTTAIFYAGRTQGR